MLIGSLGILVIAGMLILVQSPPASRGFLRTAEPVKRSPIHRYVGDVNCRSCHPNEYALHRHSGHARTLRPAGAISLARWLNRRAAEDPERPGVTWSYELSDGRLTAQRTEAGTVDRFLVEYAFGSGHHATTFVSLTERDPTRPIALEHRLTYFAHSQSLGLTPGQSLTSHAAGNSPRGRIHTNDDTLKCFGCHATATSDRGPDVLDETTLIPNVSCERCHGAGRLHVEAARRGTVENDASIRFRLGRWTADEQLRLCGSCHRLPSMMQPGSIRVDNPALVRHQPVGLMQSACYIRSSGALTCLTCHDPHARTSQDRPAYEAICLSCHQSPSQASCRISARANCLNCHMPRRDVTRGMVMTDHWIRIVPGRGTHGD
jgi:hypothetical protein